MQIRYVVLLVASVIMYTGMVAQTGRGLTGFPELVVTHIPGAPKLSTPMLVTGTERPVISEGFGLAAPAFYDWDGDGVNDLLIGEFGSGVEKKLPVPGSYIRVFKNTGTNAKPAFSGKWDYARPPFEYQALANGTPYSVDEGCCMGFAPQFIDLDNDGKQDMISGQYMGEVSWLKATDKGFLPAQPLSQAGNPRGNDHLKEQDYWLFSSASMGDFTADGRPDLVLGGSALRISINTGTAEEPSFGRRDTLLNVDGKPLKVYDFTEKEKKDFEIYTKTFGMVMAPIGDSKVSPFVIDWDNDGLLDILVTNSYTHTGLSVVDFFKGVKTSAGYRFEKPVPLFTAKNAGKPFPGSGPKISVCDWNSDGINDLLIGASIATINGKFNDRFAWNWEDSVGINAAGKDPGNVDFATASPQELKSRKEYYAKHLPKGITLEDYMTIRHRGYVYVLLGLPAGEAGKK